MSTQFIIIMGVSGSGKTTAGKLLAEKTGWRFCDADDFHPAHNIEKMRSGVPLTDEDRWPWLQRLNRFVKNELQQHSVILACSALKQVYRERLCESVSQPCRFVLLTGDHQIILERMKSRQHYMAPALLQSQFDILEVPPHALVVDVTQPVADIVAMIVATLT